MLEVAICDDQRACVDDTYRHVKRTLAQKNIEVHFTAFLSGQRLLECDRKFDIVLLDIEMPGMDGIEVGKRLRTRDEKCKIIMVTSMKERYKDAFRFQAFRFVTKPIDAAELEEAIAAATNVPIGTETIEVYSNRIPYDIAQRDICYIKAYNGYLEVTAGDRFYRREDSLVSLSKELNAKLFFRINRQCIINMRAVSRITDSSVMIGKEQFPLSVRIRKQFEKQYMEYDVNYGLHA